MLSEDKDMDIEGLKYKDIVGNAERNSYLESLLSNLP